MPWVSSRTEDRSEWGTSALSSRLLVRQISNLLGDIVDQERPGHPTVVRAQDGSEPLLPHLRSSVSHA
eukprot:SAG25_NODE_396_length_8539_cov_5.889336_2_plen_68_part_00